MIDLPVALKDQLMFGPDSTYDDASFVTLCQNLLAGVKDNPNYPAPPQKPTELLALLDEGCPSAQ